MNIVWAGPAASTNYQRGRLGWNVDRILDHWSGSPYDTVASVIRHFNTPGVYVSAHFVIGPEDDDTIYQDVDLADGAYSGEGTGPNDPPRDPNMNERCVAIEHIPVTLPDGSLGFTDATYRKSAWLHDWLRKGNAGIAELILGVDPAAGDGTVYPHRANTATQCPGTLDIPRILKEADVAQQPQLVEKSWAIGAPDGSFGPAQPGDPCNADALKVGQVAVLAAKWRYPDGSYLSMAPAKVGDAPPNRYVFAFYPPVSPADTTLDLGATPATFVVDVLPA